VVQKIAASNPKQLLQSGSFGASARLLEQQNWQVSLPWAWSVPRDRSRQGFEPNKSRAIVVKFEGRATAMPNWRKSARFASRPRIQKNAQSHEARIIRRSSFSRTFAIFRRVNWKCAVAGGRISPETHRCIGAAATARLFPGWENCRQA